MKKIDFSNLSKKQKIAFGGTTVVVLVLIVVLALFVPRDARIVFYNDRITTGPGSYGFEVAGTNLRIRQSGKYYISGNCTEDALGCTVLVDKNLQDVTLVLDNLTLTSSYGAPIMVRKETNVQIILKGESVLTDNDQREGAAIKIGSKANLRMDGEGSLVVSGMVRNGIKGGKDSSIVTEGGNYSIVAVNDAIHGGDRVSLLGGKFMIEAGDDGVHADKSLTLGTYEEDYDLEIEVKKSKEGLEADSVFILSGKIDVTADDDGINAGDGTGGDDDIADDEAVNNGQGDVNAGASGSDDVNGGVIDNGGTPCSAKSNNGQVTKQRAMTSGSSIWIYGGDIKVNAGGDGIDANGNIYFYGGRTVVWGMEEGGLDEAIDHAAGLVINRGEFFAGESSGDELIHEWISSTEQGFIYAKGVFEAGDEIEVINPEGEVVLNVIVPKKVGYIMYTSPKMPLEVQTQASNGWRFHKK